MNEYQSKMSEATRLGEMLEGYLLDYEQVIKEFPKLEGRLTFEAYLNFASLDYYIGQDLYHKVEDIENLLEKRFDKPY